MSSSSIFSELLETPAFDLQDTKILNHVSHAVEEDGSREEALATIPSIELTESRRAPSAHRSELAVSEGLAAINARLLAVQDALSDKDAELGSLLEQIGRLYQQLALMHRVAKMLQRRISLQELVYMITEELPATIAADAVGLFLPKSHDGGASSVVVPGHATDSVNAFAKMLQQEHRGKDVVILVSPSVGEHTGFKNGSVCAAPITTADNKRGWLIAQQKFGRFGTEEGQLLRSLAVILAGQLDNDSLLREKDEMLLAMVRSFTSALDARDKYTRGHSERVAAVACELARRHGLDEKEIELIQLAGLLHDVGKIGISDAVLRKAEALSAEEWLEVKRHPVIGYEILKRIGPFQPILPGVRSHHEAYDGSGYPDGLAGEDIPMMARILAVADSFDAMSSSRTYRRGKPPEEVDASLAAGAGRQWDPAIVKTYMANRKHIRHRWNVEVAVQF